MLNTCEKCPYFYKVKIPNDVFDEGIRYNTYCLKTPSSESRRLIEVNVHFDQKLEKPTWCPMKQNNNIVTKPMNANDWTKLEERIPFNKLTFGVEYHIPPFGMAKRRTAKVSAKNDSQVWLNIMSDNKNSASNTSLTIFPTSIIAKVITINKLPKFEFPDEF